MKTVLNVKVFLWTHKLHTLKEAANKEKEKEEKAKGDKEGRDLRDPPGYQHGRSQCWCRFDHGTQVHTRHTHIQNTHANSDDKKDKA